MGPVETWADPADISEAELALTGGAVDEARIRSAVEQRRVVDLRLWAPPASLNRQVESVPEGAVVVDVREPDEGPLVGDLSLPHSRATEAAARLDREATYVLVCATGRRSLAMAQDLSRMGFRAYSLVGGVRRLPEAAA